MPLHGIWLINYPIKDQYILRSFTAAWHKSNTTIHLVLSRKGTVVYYYQAYKSRIYFIYNQQVIGKINQVLFILFRNGARKEHVSAICKSLRNFLMRINKSILIKTILLYLAKGIVILLRWQVFLRKLKTVR